MKYTLVETELSKIIEKYEIDDNYIYNSKVIEEIFSYFEKNNIPFSHSYIDLPYDNTIFAFSYMDHTLPHILMLEITYKEN